MPFATGKYAKAISDRSGMEFPYKEMVKEWNGSFVHRSEFEAKHPQLEPRKHKPDAQALQDARTPKKLNPVTADDRKITSTFKSDNATLLVSSLTLTASLGSESVSVS